MLRSQIRVNGRKLVAQMTVDEQVWAMQPEGLNEHLQESVRRQIIEGIVTELDPPVTVYGGPQRLRGRRRTVASM